MHHVAPQQKCKFAEPACHLKPEMDFGNVMKCQFDGMNILCHADINLVSFHVLFRPFQTHPASQDRKKTREELRKPIESCLDILGLQYCAPYQISAVFPHTYRKGDRRGIRTQ